MKTSLRLITLLLAVTSLSAAEKFTFPKDPSVLDAKRDFGALGDGKADDTDALQRAMDASCGVDKQFRGKSNALFIPNGTYRVTKTLVVKIALGPWLYGESRDGVVIKLDDGVKGVNSVLRTHPNENGPTSADWFMRNLRNFTIDVGNNPETDGIRYYATNSGSLKNVRVIGKGKIGINAGFLDQSGPNLIQDVEIDGFETGIKSEWIWGQTISRAKIKNCSKVGLTVSANVVAVEDLTVENTPLAIMNNIPNDWGHWCGVISLIGGKFTGGAADGPAIINKGKLYARNIQTTGFARAIESNGSQKAPEGANVDEFVSNTTRKAFDDSPETALNLPIEREPVVEWENDASKWLCADEYGAIAGDNQDDSDAIQKAMDAAAAQGKTVVYFRGIGGGDPNWFTVKRPIRVPKPVRMVMGLGWARLLNDSKDQSGGFIVDDDSAPVVKFQNIDAFGGTPIQLVNKSKANVLFAESCGVSVVGKGAGSIFMTDCPSGLDLQNPGQKCWTRQLNPEGTSDTGVVKNNGADLWCLGVKHEGLGIRFSTRNGGRTEVMGLFNYGGYKDDKDPRPLFEIIDASLTIAGLREIAFESNTALNKVREKRGEDTRIIDREKESGWIGWALFSGFKK
jgi:hypothetical protein